MCRSITEKAQYVVEKGLGGAMVWAIEQDDLTGACGEKNPLAQALNAIVHN